MTSFFCGAITALITPFNDQGVDYDALEKLVEHQARHNIKALVIAGSTGEASTLSYDEYLTLSKAAIALGKQHNIKIIIGVGFNATHQALEAIHDLNKLAPDSIMCTCPAYNKPTQEGLYQHFKALHDASDMPIMLYSVPSRTGVDYSDATLTKLAALPKIKAFKDAASDIERPLRLSQATDLQLLSGEDSLVLAHMALGAHGVVSVLSNIAPSYVQQIIDAFNAGNHAHALQKQHEVLELTHLLFAESNPIGVKCAAHILGLCENNLRLPLVSATPELHRKLEQSLQKLF